MEIFSVACGLLRKNLMSLEETHNKTLTIFLCGDVMTGRGIDQILPHPSDPELHEPYVKSAVEYVDLSQCHSGSFDYPVDFSYIWGDALEEWRNRSPDLKIINLETSITQSKDFWKNKGIHYKMHPANIQVLQEARIDCCCLANNHVLDWGYFGLEETLLSLERAHLKKTGAGRNLEEARAPAIFQIPAKCRVLIFTYGAESSGVPADWAATQSRPGVNVLNDLSHQSVDRVIAHIRTISKAEDFIVFSVHWGNNWGYRLSTAEIEFAHRLIDEGGVNVIHGHSSHHVKGIEIYKSKLILYGCGDFLNDYEGITGYEEFRGDLSLMYFASFDPGGGSLRSLEMIPTKMQAFQVRRASGKDAEWLKTILNRECERFSNHCELLEKEHSAFLRMS
jgi:poly-gamma-glutamate synthesis protein (capsule biosynthesis protein)